MSWIHRLYETYENCSAAIGSLENSIPLLPICHTTQKAQVEIVINGQGDFLRAAFIPNDDARTVIPCTENSAGRTNGEAPHPLCDKLQYIAADYAAFGAQKDSYFESYRKQMELWCSSKYANPKTEAVLNYIRKGRVIADLLQSKVLLADADGQLAEQWNRNMGEQPAVYKRMSKKPEETFRDMQLNLFVRFRIEIPNQLESASWLDKDLQQDWIAYYTGTKEKQALCYVTGQERLIADQHPAKLRNDGDKAKIISANDTSGFTFRGRYAEWGQAGGVGFDVTQKAHSALRWLVGRQGWHNGDQCIVAWATSGADIPMLQADTFDLLGGLESSDDLPYTAEEFAYALNKHIAGYHGKIGSDSDIVIMTMDSATPGRMSITYYRELTGSDFLTRVTAWHEGCRWAHDYRSREVEGPKK